MKLEPTPGWTSSRVQLFVLEPSAVTPRYVSWLNDPEINRYLESRYIVHTETSTREFVAAALAHPDILFLGIRSLELGGTHVGNIKIEINRRYGLGEIGILIGERSAHGRGIATDSIALIAGIARDQLHLRKVTAGCYGSNGGSERAFVKSGFLIEGRRKAHYLLDGEPEDLVLMGRLL